MITLCEPPFTLQPVAQIRFLYHQINAHYISTLMQPFDTDICVQALRKQEHAHTYKLLGEKEHDTIALLSLNMMAPFPVV